MKIDSNLHITKKEIESFGTSVEEITKLLTLPNPEYITNKRFGRGFYKKVDKFICYLEKRDSQYILPRFMLDVSKVGDVVESGIIAGRKTTYKLKDVAKLRDYQEEFLLSNLDSIKENDGTLIEMPCGHGKTFCAIYLSAVVRKRQTIVVVPTYYLAKQWEGAITFFSTATTYIMTSTDTDVPLDSDFTIVVTDLLTVRTLPEKLIKNIGHIILDEAHRMGAETYLPILKETPAKYRTALTATFRREDGVHKILKFHFGEHYKMVNQFPKPEVYALTTGITIRGVLSKSSHKTDNLITYMQERNIPYHETSGTIDFFWDFIELIDKDVKDKVITAKLGVELRGACKKAGKVQYTSIDSYLNQHSKRRKLVIKLIKESLEAGRTVLFLSKRKDILKVLHKYFAEYKPMLIISETNKRTEAEDLYLQKECRLLLGVTQLAKEGLDVDRLDTLIIYLPIKDTEQAIGRIARIHPDKKQPIAVYLLDNHPMLYSTYTKAKKIMKVNGDFKGELSLSNLIKKL